MPTDVSLARTTEWFRLVDAKDESGLRAMLADDVQGVDEVTRGWVREPAAIEAYFHDLLPAISDMHSTVTDLEARSWGDVAVETSMVHQTAVVGGKPIELDAPTTTIWRREGGTWKLALIHTVPLPET
jgi:ketosteroid isomerase-like protein